MCKSLNSLNQISNPIEVIGFSLIDFGFEFRNIVIKILPIILLRTSLQRSLRVQRKVTTVEWWPLLRGTGMTPVIFPGVQQQPMLIVACKYVTQSK